MNINQNNPFVDAKGIKQKRQILSQLSRPLQMIRKMTGENVTVNEILITTYQNSQHQQFNTYQGWKKEGKQVKKGAKAFCVWGRKRKNDKKEESNNGELSFDKPDQKKDEKELSFFPIAHIFSNYQVK